MANYLALGIVIGATVSSSVEPKVSGLDVCQHGESIES